MGSSHRKFLVSAAPHQIAVCIFPEPPPQVDEFTNGLGGHTWLNPSRAQCGFVLVQPEKENESRCLRDYGLCTIAFDEAWGRCSEPAGDRAASCRPVDGRFVAHPAGYP